MDKQEQERLEEEENRAKSEVNRKGSNQKNPYNTTFAFMEKRDEEESESGLEYSDILSEGHSVHEFNIPNLRPPPSEESESRLYVDLAYSEHHRPTRDR